MSETDARHVAQTVYEFAYGIDGRDWTRYRSIFCDEAEFDYSSYHGRPASRMSADDWVAGVTPLFEGLDATQHTMSNPIVELGSETGGDPDRARCRVYMQAAHFLANPAGDSEFTIGGYYDDRLVRTGAGPHGGWQIEAVTLTVWWRRGNPDIMRLARA